MAQVVLAWNLSKDFISAPILGTSSVEKLRDSVGTFSETPLLSPINQITDWTDLL